MKYTLDSLHQVETALREKFKGSRITSTQVILTGDEMAALKEDPRKVFFGVMTVGQNVKANLSYRGKQIITVEAGSQIIEAFTDVSFVDNADQPASPIGQFRGALIQILI